MDFDSREIDKGFRAVMIEQPLPKVEKLEKCHEVDGRDGGYEHCFERVITHIDGLPTSKEFHNFPLSLTPLCLCNVPDTGSEFLPTLPDLLTVHQFGRASHR